MNTILLHPDDQFQQSFLVKPPKIYINGVRSRQIELLEWNLDNKNDWGSIKLVAGAFPSTVSLVELPDIGSSVEIKSQYPGGMIFSGFVTRHEIKIDSAGEVIAVAENELAAGMAQNIAGRYVEQAAPIFIDEPLRFNMTSADSMGTETHELNGKSCKIFSAGDSGELWSVGNAIAYILATSLAGDFDCTSYSELIAMAGDIYLPAYDATKLSARQAIVEIARMGGLCVRVSRDSKGLVIFDSSSKRRKTTIRLQQMGESLDTAQSNVLSGTISLKARPTQRPVRMIGDYKRYESTFTLCPGWDESLNTRQWQRTVQADNENWSANRFLYRRWILNENNENRNYSEFDFASLNVNDFISSRSRKFMPCLSKSQNKSNGLIVEYRLDKNDSWKIWDGAFWVSDDDCSIIFTDNNLSPDYLVAAYAQTLEVRITASVEADKRLVVEIPGDPLTRWDIHDYSGSAAIWLLHPTSDFYSGNGVDPQIIRDDTKRLTTIAQKFSAANSAAIQAKISLAWVDMSYHIGDEISSIEGAEIDLISHSFGRPVVTSVRHEFLDGQQTNLVIEG